MALHLTPEEHDADPPSGWTVRKTDKHGRRWSLCNKNGGVLDTFPTRREAEAGKTSGRLFDVYQKEGRWFAGLPVGNWKPYAQAVAERNDHVKKCLERLRVELRAERISYGELAELQSLAAYIDPADVELLEVAGVSEEEYRAGLKRASQ